IQALNEALAADADQVLVLSGDLKRLRFKIHNTSEPPQSEIYYAVDAGKLTESTLQQLKLQLSAVTKLRVAQIDAQEPLENYGIDSVMITQLNQKLAETFGELPKTLFFEHRNLTTLTEFLVDHHAAACARWTGLDNERRGPSKRDLPWQPAVGSTVATLASPRMSATSTLPHRRRNSGKQVRDPIAIIGLAGRYPHAETIDEFWANLVAGRDCITEVPADRWSLEGFYQSEVQEAIDQQKSYSKWGGFIDGFNEFDPLFFGISPRNAANIDPQERLFLQCVFSALEDAGYTRQRLADAHQGRVGVFAGITTTGFDRYGLDLSPARHAGAPHTSFSSLANRVSYFLDLHGPSMPIDTMCSSSLTAIHEACIHMLRGECDLAIAGGVNLYVHPSSYVLRSAQRMLSAHGQCKSFGQGGDGYVPGEGVGAVLLKSLCKAIEDGDHIYGIIKGSAINHGGKTNGYTVPDPNSQAAVIAQTIKESGINPRTITYIEAHGTGTSLGDPIEIAGLTKAFDQFTQDKEYCAIGSVKSNIGHCESAAGIAGLTKVLLQMREKTLVKSLHSQELNPNIDFSKTPFTVQQDKVPWQRPRLNIDGTTREYPRIAGISSFGAGGVNAHVVIEEYVPRDEVSGATAISR
ncbi:MULTISPECIES: type I polyketide synthase, partial [unclassified Bradyrhizobium]|uniref:type I polyketide synthase n=1 Tax=unclassified Bradyrhizobium TaxID=2631580 RepID=UPI0029167357